MSGHDPVEPRYRSFNVLGLIMDQGPQNPDEIIARLYPGGTHGRGDKKGESVRKDPRSIQTKLKALVDRDLLCRGADGRYALGPDLGTVWVVYVGSERGYIGVYNAALQPVPSQSGPGSDVAWSILENIGEAGRVRSHQVVLARCLASLAEIVLVADEQARKPRALVIGLPAALSLDNLRVQGEAPQGWTDPQLPTIDKMVEDTWRSLRLRSRQRGSELPDLPRAADDSVALIADSDVVLDTLGAMYNPTRIGVKQSDPRQARVLLGVKHSVSIRSTVVMRGPADLYLHSERRRRPGHRRDRVYRGAFGDTIGLRALHRANQARKRGNAGAGLRVHSQRGRRAVPRAEDRGRRVMQLRGHQSAASQSGRQLGRRQGAACPCRPGRRPQ